MQKLSTIIVKSYKLLLTFWILLTLGMGYFAIQLPSLLEGDGFRTDGEYEQVQSDLTETFDFPESSILVLFENEDKSKEEFSKTIETTLNEIKELGVSSTITSPLEDESLRKEKIAYAVINYNDESLEMAETIDKLREITNDEENITLTGAPVISEDINHASQNDLKRAELIGLPIALIVLLLAFGTVIASLLPLIIGGVTIAFGFGLLAIIGENIQLSIFILNIAPMIGLALSIDFALLFINRYKEEIQSQEKDEALMTTIQTAGRSILFSALCVFIGLAAMIVIEVDIFKNIAIGGTVVITGAVLASLTLLPSLLYVLGPRIHKWRILATDKDTTARWRKYGRWVMKHPGKITLAALLVLLIGVIPLKNIDLTIPDIESLPKSYDSRQAFETIEAEFMGGSESTSYLIAERNGDWLSQEGLEQMKQLQEKLQKPSIVESVTTLYTGSKMDSADKLSAALEQPQSKAQLDPLINQFVRGDQLLIPIELSVESSSEAAQDLMREWQETDWEVDVMLGGQPKFNQEIYDEIKDKVLVSLAIILVSTFFILMLAFRSIIIPLKAILMNIIGLASTFGVLVWLFQGGHLGLSEAEIALILPVIVFSLVFGLSMDYEVFLISRMQEYYLETGNNTTATIEGLANTSKIITSAALIMIVITGAFAFTGVVPVKQIGIGIAIAIFIDATIIRLLLVPSLMKLLGRWNWWFPFGKKKKSKAT
ncbi:MMPL family transporter [Thalassobacillus pellis]|uniref:MMPL family transporter n=1 Tax=Thalassobacillus pellis TaxID=748008 RepID=UPI001EF7ADDF|nr:MMPL family transporter [Thalassobacillus pellis]MBM7554252.1 RND superfamily putative drug exporter [Thalassobacillus pellis]